MNRHAFAGVATLALFFGSAPAAGDHVPYMTNVSEPPYREATAADEYLCVDAAGQKSIHSHPCEDIYLTAASPRQDDQLAHLIPVVASPPSSNDSLE